MVIRGGLRDQFDWPLFVTVAAIALVGRHQPVQRHQRRHGGHGRHLHDADLLAGARRGRGRGGGRRSTIATTSATASWPTASASAPLVLLFILGRSVRGSVRWLSIGAFSLQPSELMKIFLIIALAKYLHNDPKTTGRTLRDLLGPGLILALPMVLILKQPDLGTALICARHLRLGHAADEPQAAVAG